MKKKILLTVSIVMFIAGIILQIIFGGLLGIAASLVSVATFVYSLLPNDNSKKNANPRLPESKNVSLKPVTPDPVSYDYIALNGKTHEVRLEAIKRVSNQQVLREVVFKYRTEPVIFLGDSPVNVEGRTAVNNITDAGILTEIQCEHIDEKTCKLAMIKFNSLNDKPLIVSVEPPPYLPPF